MKGKRASQKFIRWLLISLVWIAFIWGHSLIQGPGSTQESGRIVALLAPLFRTVGVTDTNVMSFCVRKTAHFSEYALLGILATCVIRAAVLHYKKAPQKLRILFVIAYACVAPLDEAIQLGVPGRQGSAVDVVIDLAGYGMGLLLMYLWKCMHKSAHPCKNAHKHQ